MRLGRVTSRIGVVLVTGGLFLALSGGAALAQGSPNGASTQRPVFYEGRQVTVNMFEVPASDPLLAQNKGASPLYRQFTREGNAIRIWFDNAGTALKTRGGGPVRSRAPLPFRSASTRPAPQRKPRAKRRNPLIALA